MHLRFETNHEKATQSLNYFARMQGGEINKMKALKLIFFADRYHLRKWGRPIIGDSYWAMSYGPVASMAMNLAEGDSWLDDCERSYSDKFLVSSEDRRYVRSTDAVEEDVFSDSDLEALQFAWSHLGLLSQWDLVELSHAYPEWLKHKESLARGNCKRAEMEYADFFEEPDPDDPSFRLVAGSDIFSAATSEEEKAVAMERAEESARIRAFWDG